MDRERERKIDNFALMPPDTVEGFLRKIKYITQTRCGFLWTELPVALR